MKKTIILSLLLFFFSNFVSAKLKPIKAFVSIEPQRYIVEQICGKSVSVMVLVKAGQNPHTFEPTPHQIVELNNAQIYFTIGLPSEPRILQKIYHHKHFLHVEMDKDIIRRNLISTIHTSNKNRKAEPVESSHKDPHIWLNYTNIIKMGETVEAAMSSLLPRLADTFEENFITFKKKVSKSENKTRELLSPFKGRSFFVFHPAYGYFGDEFKLQQRAVEVEGKLPTPRQLVKLIKLANRENISVIFVQPQYDKKTAEVVAKAINGKIVAIDPMAYDLLKTMRNFCHNLVLTLKR